MSNPRLHPLPPAWSTTPWAGQAAPCPTRVCTRSPRLNSAAPPPAVWIILCGFGVVGRSLAKLFESRSDDLYACYGLKPRIVGVFDSAAAAAASSDPSALDLERLVAAYCGRNYFVGGYP